MAKAGSDIPTGSSKSNHSKSPSSLTGTQKAALFVVALGPEVAAKIFKRLKESELARLSQEIVNVERVDPFVKASVLSEFKELLKTEHLVSTGGKEFAQAALEKSVGKARANEILQRLESERTRKPFSKLSQANPKDLVTILENEHPQTIAVVLAHLDSTKASTVLREFPAEEQASITKRIAKMDKMDPALLKEIEQSLESQLEQAQSDVSYVSGGADTVASLLQHLSRSDEQHIIDRIEDDDPDLAFQLKQRRYIFEDITRLDDRSIKRLIAAVTDQQWIKAFKKADSEVMDKIFSQMSKRRKELIVDEIKHLGPMRVSEIEEAQRTIVAIIQKLDQEGKIIVPRKGEEDIFVE